jgi:hypothetical protein
MTTVVREHSPAEKRWGYAFGIDGVVSSSAAREMLGGVCLRTLKEYAADNLIRIGYRKPGVPSSGITVCRRSLMAYIASCER